MAGSEGGNAGAEGSNARLGAPGSLDLPSRPQSPYTEFVNGYSLGLIGGVRSWVGSPTVSKENMS